MKIELRQTQEDHLNDRQEQKQEMLPNDSVLIDLWLLAKDIDNIQRELRTH